MGQLQLTVLMWSLSDKQRENRQDAYTKAWRWLGGLMGGAGTGDGRSFPTDRSGLYRYWQRRRTRDCPAAECRIDVEITAGRAFIF